MIFLFSVFAGFISHLTLYDILQTLPFPDLASYATGIVEVYPIAKYRHDKGQRFESSYLLSFLGFGIGVLIGRIRQGIKKAS